jgi:hypothetical protein
VPLEERSRIRDGKMKWSRERLCVLGVDQRKGPHGAVYRTAIVTPFSSS